MIFRQLYDLESSTYTYLLADDCTKEAVLIDPVKEQIERDLKLIQELGLKLVTVLDTHVHADHITAAGQLRNRTGCKTGLSARYDVTCADLMLNQGDVVRIGEQVHIRVLETPGHTNGCLTYQCEDMVFTGDALLVRGCGRTDFQNGSARTLYESVTGKLFTLPDSTRVYPAHDYRGHMLSTIGEEKRLNPRLTKTREDFEAFMANLKLTFPKKIMEAVPANQACGLAVAFSDHGRESPQDAATH